MKRSTFLRQTAGLLALGSPAAPLTTGEVRAQRTQASVTLNFWQPLGDPVARSALLPYVQKFNQSHPNINVNFVVVSHANNYVKYTTAMAAGRGPDVIMTTSFNPPVPEFAANALIQPVDPWFKQLGVSEDQWLPWTWKMQTFHGHTWGFLQQYDTFLFVWNKTDFKKAGLDPDQPPRTMAELYAYAEKMTKFDSSGKLVQAGFVPWVWPQGGFNPNLWLVLFGGQFYDPNRRTYTLNIPANVQALEWMAKFAKLVGGPDKVNGLVGQYQGNNDPFYTGQVAMAIVGEWAPSFIHLYAPHFKYGADYGAAALPTAPGVPYGTDFASGGDTFVMPAGTKHPKEAAEFMLYMMQPAPLLTWCILESNMPPTRASAFSSRYLKGVPTNASAIATAREALKNVKLLPSSSTSPVEDYAWTVYTTAQQEVLYGRQSAKEALDAAQKQVEQREQTLNSTSPGWG